MDSSIVVKIVSDFLTMKLLQFNGYKVDEDPQEFIDKLDPLHRRNLNVQARDVNPLHRKEFKGVFLNHFFSLELREAKIHDFINLKQGGMSVRKYTIKFAKLAKYSSLINFDSMARMSKFISSVFDLVYKECKLARLIKEMDILRVMTYEEHIDDKKL